jgi:exosortase
MSLAAFNLREQARRARPLLLIWLAGAAIWLFHAAFLASTSRQRGLGRIEEAFFDPQATTPMLSLGVFLYLLHHRRAVLRAALGRPASIVPGAGWFGLGVAVLAWADSIDAPDLARLAFVFFVLGAGFWLGGRRLARSLAFPLLAILLSVPLPSALTNQILLPLQVWTADLASGLLTLLGQSHVLMGDEIYRDGLTFHVIEGCSGFRSIFSLWLAGVLYADLACRSTREKIALLAAVPFVGFLLNGLRVLVLILREVSAETAEHAIQGLVMIVLGVVVLAALEIKLWPILFARSRSRQRGPWRVETKTRSAVPDAPPFLSLDRRLVVLAALLMLLAVGTTLWPRPFPTSPPGDRLNPEEVGTGLSGMGWTIKGLRREPHRLGSTRFRHLAYRAFTRGDERITTFVGAEDRGRRQSSGWSPKTSIPASGWLSRAGLSRTMVGDQPIERTLVRYPDRTVLVYHWREGYGGWFEELLWDWLSLDQTSWRMSHSSVVARVETDVGSEVGAFERADASLHSFAGQLHEDIERRIERERKRNESKRNAG